MASVAICPHCYLQLMVPDSVPRDAWVACPTCAKEFDLDQAVLRAIPEVTVVERAEKVPALAAATTVAEVEIEGPLSDAADVLPLDAPAESVDQTATPLDTAGHVDADIAAWFRKNETLPEVSDVGDVIADDDDAQTQVEDRPWPAAEEASAEIEQDEQPRAVRPTAVTLADLLPPREEPMSAPLGPSFDLPNVPLTPEGGSTLEFDSSLPVGAASTEFELDDVDFESVPANEVAPAAEEYLPEREPDPEFAGAAPAPFVVPSAPRVKRKRSLARTLVATVLGGFIGLPLGYYIVLYVQGPEGDFLAVADYLPRAILPPSFASAPTKLAEGPQTASPAVEDPAENVPASYAEEVESDSASPGSDAAIEEDRYANEPSPLAEPAAEPIAALEPLPLSGPTYSADQLTSALEAGEQVRDGLVSGDLSDASVRRTKGMSYAKLCDLANALVFLDHSTPTEEAEEIRARVERLFGMILSGEHTRDEIGRIAAIWIDSPHRRHGGIFVAGTVSGGQIAGDVYEYQLHTGDRAPLVILFREPLDPAVDRSGQPLGIVGTIVDDPAGEVTGYQGTASRAIWAAVAIPLE